MNFKNYRDLDMRKCAFLWLLVLSFLWSFKGKEVERAEFYNSLSSRELSEIDQVLGKLEKENSTATIRAYTGALLMKKAGIQKGVNSKVKTFKQGAKLLETEIQNSPENVEYRFLRLTVQEHAPGILHYDKNLNEDKVIITKGFGKQETSLKNVISKYSESSKVIKSSDLK